MSAFKAIGVVMTGVDALLEEGVNPVCVVGSDASNSVLANVLSVAAQYALLRHGLDRVGLLLNSKSLQVNAEDQNFLAVQSGDMVRKQKNVMVFVLFCFVFFFFSFFLLY